MRRLSVVLFCALLLAVPAQAEASELISFELESSVVDTTTPGGTLADGRTAPKINVLLPDGYDASAGRRYPVLWLLHGAQGGTDSWLRSPGIASLTAGFPGIIVMPDGGRWGMYMDWWNGGRRGGPAWTTYHLEELRSEIERRFPIRSGRRWHAIGGISMGGQGALRYAAMLPGYFGSVAVFSAAFPDMQAPDAQVGLSLLPTVAGAQGVTYAAMFGPAHAAYAAGNSPKALAPNYGHTRVYLTSGNGINCRQDPVNPLGLVLDTITETFIRAQQAPFAVAARAAGAEVTERTTCGIHTFGVWDRAIPEAIANWGFFEPVVKAPSAWTYRTVRQSGEMWGLRYRFAGPPDRLAEFVRDGQTLAGTGAGSVTLAGPDGCEVTVALPFEIGLPGACLPAPAASSGRRFGSAASRPGRARPRPPAR